MKAEPGIFDNIDATADAAADLAGLADLDAGRTISHEAMKRWLTSWGTPGELPPPNVGD
jgi:predicted transcriptional regulator